MRHEDKLLLVLLGYLGGSLYIEYIKQEELKRQNSRSLWKRIWGIS